ncbi:MAG: 50S ribosomal protein L1 [Anaerolineaceae bacterium 4572_5.1]|nr:MAG: 50S ribosomal protein L1 [Anaerolineaceae bacterium 4572_5.1]RLD03493.1 MAG: 50S ribosomal protein L1 [Chloroflexota bacterium]
MAKHGKKYTDAVKKIDSDRLYSPREALKLAQELSYTSFDETVEIHARLNVDPRHADQLVRDVIVLPHGLGKTVRVLVFAQGEDAQLARDAGADFVADDDEFINKIAAGWLEFDIAIATPPMMGKVGRLGRVLGPRGLMPNPKAGTMVPGDDIPRAIKESKAGRVEYRVDRTANIHAPIGKISFDTDKLVDNMAVLMESIVHNRPAVTKGRYILRVVVSASMGPGINVDPTQAENMKG